MSTTRASVIQSRNTTPLLSLPHREYRVYRGRLDDVVAVSELSSREQPVSVNLWWAINKTWIVATDVDLTATYVGGPVQLIASVIADELLKGTPASLHDKLTSKA